MVNPFFGQSRQNSKTNGCGHGEVRRECNYPHPRGSQWGPEFHCSTPQQNRVACWWCRRKGKLFRQATKPLSRGGNPNQIREFKEQIGRIFSVDFNPKGNLGFSGSSLDGEGEVRCFEIDSQTTMDPIPKKFSSLCSP